jgi:hypothetical protein
VSGSHINLYGSHINLYGSHINLYGSYINLYGSQIKTDSHDIIEISGIVENGIKHHNPNSLL